MPCPTCFAAVAATSVPTISPGSAGRIAAFENVRADLESARIAQATAEFGSLAKLVVNELKNALQVHGPAGDVPGGAVASGAGLLDPSQAIAQHSASFLHVAPPHDYSNFL